MAEREEKVIPGEPEREPLHMYQALYDGAPDMMVSLDPKTAKVVTYNQTLATKLGYSRSELLGRSIFDLYHPDCHERARAAFRSFVDTGEVQGVELQLKRSDGTRIDVSLSVLALRDANGELLQSNSILRDLTASNLAKAKRLELEQQLAGEKENRQLTAHVQLALEDMPNGVVLVNAAGEILFVNKQTLAMFGFTSNQLIGESVEILVPEPMRPRHVEDRARFMANPEIRSMGAGRDLRARRRDGTEFSVEVGLSSIQSEQTLVLASIIDISKRKRIETEQRKLEKKVQETQRLESLGLLAGGIAHDFNNLLMGVFGNADLALAEVSPVSPIRDRLQAIKSAAEKMANLARQMLAYAGRVQEEHVSLDLNELVEEMAHLLSASLARNTVLTFDLYPVLPRVLADPSQVGQIVLNLIVNASEAIGDKSGVVTIRTGVADANSDYLSEFKLGSDLEAGQYVFMEVCDTGSGMDQETIDQIFDPFFTTKFEGRGLGLAALQGIVRSHGGAIKVYSEIGTGTTFKVLLPSVAAPSEAANPIDEPLWKGEGTALLIDDDETARAVGKSALEQLGFTVMTAEGGEQGLELLTQAPVAIVLLDWAMPHLRGDEVARKITKLRPGTKVVVASGYSARELKGRFAGKKGIDGFVQKPYDLLLLAAELRRVIDEAGGNREPRRISSTRILIAEDDAAIRVLLTEALTDRGALVETAADGAEALAAFKAAEFDLLVTDLIMPSLGGVELAAEVLALKPGTHVLYMTGHASEEAINELHATGARVLCKPFSIRTFLASIETVIQEDE